MIKSSICAATAARPARCRKTVLCTLLFAFVAAMSATADDELLVPNNIAAHPAPVQPLPFSHKTHVTSGLACQACHVNPEPGNQMTFPATETCMGCHRTIATDKPAIKSLQTFAESGQKIPWVRVYTITPGVSWGHRAHLDAGAQCETCHGDISQVETVAETKAIRAMASCISCHQAREAPAECVNCHAWPTDQILGFE